MGDGDESNAATAGSESILANLASGRTSDDGIGPTVVRDPGTPRSPDQPTPGVSQPNRRLVTVDWPAVVGPIREYGRRWAGWLRANPKSLVLGLAAVTAVAVMAAAVVIVTAPQDDLAGGDRYEPGTRVQSERADAEAAKAAAAKVATQANALALTDPLGALRLQLMAFGLDPDEQRLPLVELLRRADDLAPSVTVDVMLPTNEPIVGAAPS